MKESEQRKKEDRDLIRDCFWKFKVRGLDAEQVIEQLKLEPKQKLELNRWIVDDNSPEWMICLKGDTEYFGMEGKRFFKRKYRGNNIARLEQYNSRVGFRYATDEEILERLSKIAVEMGYKERQSECLSDVGGSEEVNLNYSDFELDSDGCLWIIEDALKPYRRSNEIFNRGKWADFIETDSEKIERLEKEVKELKNKIK